MNGPVWVRQASWLLQFVWFIYQKYCICFLFCFDSTVETYGLDKSSWCCLKTKITQHGEAIQKPTSVPGLFLIVSRSNFTFVVGIWKTKLGNHNVGVF